MSFELKFALKTLESRTPPYFTQEALADAPISPEVREILKSLGIEPTATRLLIERLKLY